MAKAVRSLLALAVLAAVLVAAAMYFSKAGGSSGPEAGGQAEKKQADPKLRVEEKYGFTSEGLGGG